MLGCACSSDDGEQTRQARPEHGDEGDDNPLTRMRYMSALGKDCAGARRRRPFSGYDNSDASRSHDALPMLQSRAGPFPPT